MSKLDFETKCPLCASLDNNFILSIDKKPAGETDYGIPENKYYREISQCNNCDVFFNSREDLIPKDFYEGKYNNAIVTGNLNKRFSKIITFPFSESDNKNRVNRIIQYLYQHDYPIKGMNVLDVGAGTCVFLHEMKKFGLNTFCIDPDSASTKHSQEIVKVDEAYNGTLETVDFNKKFDLITFNKVLEHVKDPINILKQAKKMLTPNGIIYVELPNGTSLAQQKQFINRAEFYIDHHTIFTEKSFSFLCRSSDLKCELISQIIDPSGKHTIFGFLY